MIGVISDAFAARGRCFHAGFETGTASPRPFASVCATSFSTALFGSATVEVFCALGFVLSSVGTLQKRLRYNPMFFVAGLPPRSSASFDLETLTNSYFSSLSINMSRSKDSVSDINCVHNLMKLLKGQDICIDLGFVNFSA